MRIVIDMQGAQSTGSWNRGIGRYTVSFASALLRNKGEHEIIFALNGIFPDSIERIRVMFEGILPQEAMRVWNVPTVTDHTSATKVSVRHAAEIIREGFLASLKPDLVLISSLFEGLVDEAVTSINRYPSKYLNAVILYDLIPYIYQKPYLENPMVKAWYLEKIKHLKSANLWLGISKSSTHEGIKYLGLPTERTVNISTAVDEHFNDRSLTNSEMNELKKTYGLQGEFIMYTGGIDHRKNIEGLIRAYAKLPNEIRISHQLVIVCSMKEESRKRIQSVGIESGLKEDELVLPGFISEEDLIALYKCCAVFVFPSWHEGFGLPALEAMSCGAPVIAANTSSLPEVVGFEAALFDPYSDEAITKCIERVLSDKVFRAQLIEHGHTQAKKFSWDKTAKIALDAMEKCYTDQIKERYLTPNQKIKPKLAYISPLPPQRSGIADYSSELLPALMEHYQIEVIVEQNQISDLWINSHCTIRTVKWFKENYDRFDRVLYHFGNSEFHKHMFELLDLIPGVVVLHDFYLSGLLHYMDASGYKPDFFTEQIYKSHGYKGLAEAERSKDISNVIWNYPCNYEVISNSLGVIVHSENSIKLAKNWYQDDIGSTWSVIPLVRKLANFDSLNSTRNVIGFSDKAFLVCSFGMLGPTKLNHRLLESWLNSELAKSKDCYLVFVGENHPGEYGNKIVETIKNHPNGSSVRISGWVDSETYKIYLSQANVGVQLRTLSRGETSAAVLDCMNYGLATIVNANGSMADIDADAVLMLPDDFETQSLTTALEDLFRDQTKRLDIGNTGIEVIRNKHDPINCAKLYTESIEGIYEKNQFSLNKLIETVSSELYDVNRQYLYSFSEGLAKTFPKTGSRKTLYVDISKIVKKDGNEFNKTIATNILKKLLNNPPIGWVVEPIYAADKNLYCYARKFTTKLLNILNLRVADEPIDYKSGDVLIGLGICENTQIKNSKFYQLLRRQGVIVKPMLYNKLPTTDLKDFEDREVNEFKKWLQTKDVND